MRHGFVIGFPATPLHLMNKLYVLLLHIMDIALTTLTVYGVTFNAFVDRKVKLAGNSPRYGN
jgi:hypothetical protein